MKALLDIWLGGAMALWISGAAFRWHRPPIFYFYDALWPVAVPLGVWISHTEDDPS